MTRIILVRHGETDWNVEGRYQGQEDRPLSSLGLEQAELLAKSLRNLHIDHCISSPLQRSFKTCQFCADYHHLTVEADARLSEINHGSWEGQLAADIAAQYPEAYNQWHSEPHLVQMPDGGENLEDVRKRAREAFDDYAQRYPDQTLLVASHDAVNKAIICDLLGLNMSHFWQIKQDNTCVNVLEYDKGVWRVVLINSTSHMGYLFSGIEQAGL